MEVMEFKNVAGIVLLPARADGVEGYFVFDTGAMQTSLNSGYFPDLEGVDREVALFNGEMDVHGATETTLRELNLGSFTARDLKVLRMDVAYVENSLKTVEPDVRLLGSVGLEVFGDAPILLDYANSRLTLSPEIDTREAEKIELSREALPVITAELAGEPHRFVLDTGANTCLLSGELSEKVPAAPLQDTPGVYVVPEIRVGTRAYKDFNAVFTDISHIRSRVDVDGVIGCQILSPQLSLLDPANGALWLF